MRSLAILAAAVALTLPAAPASAGPIPVTVVGDSISDPYYHYQGAVNPTTGLPYWGRAGDKNWAEQLQSNRGGGVTLYNYAQAGATTADLLANGAADKAALRVKNAGVHRGVVIAGANDVLAYLNGQLGSDPAAFVAGVAGNLHTILSKIQAAGPVALVVGNIPDLSVTPSMQALLGGVPGALQQVAGLVQAANQQIAKVAAAHGAALVDLYGLSQITTGPVAIGGTTVSPSHLFAPDGFHPGSVLQGLVANSILGAFGGDLAGLRLSDQEILTTAKVPFPDGPATQFDVSSFIHQTPEPATLVLISLAGAVAGAQRIRRRVAA